MALKFQHNCRQQYNIKKEINENKRGSMKGNTTMYTYNGDDIFNIKYQV